MKEAGKAIRRVVDGVEDAVEHVLKGEEEEHEHRHRHHGGHTSTGPVTVNVNIDCCCPPKGPSGPPQPPGTRPPHVTGTSDGTLPGGVVDPGGIIGIVSRPPDVWPGPRDHLYMRPVVGPFWESPDILIEPGIDPAHAPAIPTSLGAIAKAGMDNTLYAHVWNLGQAPCPDTLVEFYWFNPALGFDAAHANLVGATWVELRARGEANSHRLVRCPVSWRAQFVNGGHECLMVRLSQAALDPLSAPAWDASRNRHIGQRNIHVMSAAEAAAKPTLAIGVGPLFGGNAAVAVQRANTGTMPWLHLVTMDRNRTPGTGAANGDVGLTPPTPEGAPLPNLGAVPDPRGAGLIGDSHGVAGDGQQVGFHATDGNPGAGQAHVYRVTGTQNGALFGGYTVVVLGE
ncbi:MAG: hypothetical protein E6I58_10845 [Chloroflexi bacterium]|nr:MAG: hypothetical protein E6I58_10845 [Chloroflexota bacterium]